MANHLVTTPKTTPKTRWAVRVTVTKSGVIGMPKKLGYGENNIANSSIVASTRAHNQLRRFVSPTMAMYITPKVMPFEKW